MSRWIRAACVPAIALACATATGCDCGGPSGEPTGGASGTSGSESSTTGGGEGGEGGDGPRAERGEPAHLSAEPGTITLAVRGGPAGDIDVQEPAKHPRSCWTFDRSDGETDLYVTSPQQGADSTDVSLSLSRKGEGTYRIGESVEDAPPGSRVTVRLGGGDRRWFLEADDVTVELALADPEARRLRAEIEGDVKMKPLAATDEPPARARLEAEVTVPWGPCASAHPPGDLAGWKGRGGEAVGEATFADDEGEHTWTFHASDVSREARDAFAARPEPESLDELAIVIWSHDLDGLDYPVELPAPRADEGGGRGRGRSPPHRVDVTYVRDGEIVTRRGHSGFGDTLTVELRSFDPDTGTLKGRFAGILGQRGGDAEVELRDGHFEVKLPQPPY